MRSFWKLLLLCCLAIALPLQGVAATTMRLCAGHTGSHAPAHVMPDGTLHHADEAGQQASVHKCSACASCCIGMGLLPALPQLAEPELAPMHPAALHLVLQPRAPDGLERPPRTTFA